MTVIQYIAKVYNNCSSLFLRTANVGPCHIASLFSTFNDWRNGAVCTFFFFPRKGETPRGKKQPPPKKTTWRDTTSNIQLQFQLKRPD
ncbi:hypothetical protein FKM82_022968 [Ascaphus truei]